MQIYKVGQNIWEAGTSAKEVRCKCCKLATHREFKPFVSKHVMEDSWLSHLHTEGTPLKFYVIKTPSGSIVTLSALNMKNFYTTRGEARKNADIEARVRTSASITKYRDGVNYRKSL